MADVTRGPIGWRAESPKTGVASVGRMNAGAVPDEPADAATAPGGERADATTAPDGEPVDDAATTNRPVAKTGDDDLSVAESRWATDGGNLPGGEAGRG